MKSNPLNEITLPALNGGLNTNEPEAIIADNQSPDMLNLWYKDMALCKRPGQIRQVPLGRVWRISDPYNGSCAVHAGTKIYRWDALGAVTLRVYNDAVTYSAGDFFVADGAVTLEGITYPAGACVIYNLSSHGQIETATVSTATSAGITTAGTARVNVTMKGSSVLVYPALSAGDSAAAAAGKIRAALAGTADITDVYSVGGSGDQVTLTRKTETRKDETLNISISNSTCAGLRTAAESVDMPFWHNAVSEVKSGIANCEGVFCEFGDVLYYIHHGEIWQFDENYVVTAVEPYIPTVLINARPNLSESDDGEAYNLLGGGFTVKYNGDGSTKTYKLPQTGLDSTAVTATVGIATAPYTAEWTEGTNFTVSRTAGTVTFTSAPIAGTDNVWITAYKTVTGARAKITACTVAVRFGGEAAGLTGGTRVFVMGNPKYPYHYWQSDLGLHVSAGMRYFPDTSEERLDQNSETITAAAKMGDQLIIFKESSIFAVGYSFDGQDVYYPVRECNNAIGCDMPGSVQLVDNRLVFAHSRSGVHMLVSSDNTLENIVKPLSANINPLLLKESDLQNAVSCDYERYYWLRAGKHVYLWDYDSTPYYNYSDYDKAQKRLAWYRFDGMPANAFFASSALHYGDDAGIVRLTPSHNDFGKAFGAYFKSKAFDLGSPEELKTFVALYSGFSIDGNIAVTVAVGSEKAECYMSRLYNIRSFNWREFDWGDFTWHRIKFADTRAMRLNMRRVSYMQVTVSGNELNRGVGLSGMRITYYRNRKMKG